MAKEVAKLVTTDMKGNTVSADKVGQMQDEAMQQTLDLAKKYIILEDASAKEKLQSLTLDDIRSTTRIRTEQWRNPPCPYSLNGCLRHSLWVTMWQRRRVIMTKSVWM